MTGDSQGPDHDTLLKLYGEAMLRIAQLEAQLAHATDQLRRRGNGSVPEAAPELTEQGLRDLAHRVDALRNLIVESNGSFTKPRDIPPPARVGAGGVPGKDDPAPVAKTSGSAGRGRTTGARGVRARNPNRVG